jgi:hypothetical protein
MRFMRNWSEVYRRSARVIVLLGFTTLVGCGSGDNVLTPTEGEAPADQAKVNTPKPNPKISSRQEREKAAKQ